MLDCVIDLSHHQALPKPIEAFRQAKAGGIAAIIHKATQGVGYTDPIFLMRRKATVDAGLLVGAYHFCDASDPTAQADHFLAIIGDTNGIMLALDAEQNVESQCSVAGLVLIASRIYRRIGRWPVIYTGRYGPTGDGKGLPNKILGGCDLWLAAYNSKPICPPGWAKWTLHQHTDGQVGPDAVPVPGIGPCDRSYFAGPPVDLATWWAAQSGGGVLPPPDPPVHPVLRRGDRGPAVAELQRRLTGLGYECGPDDGVFGSKTYLGVVALERAKHLYQTGIAGPKVWAAIAKAEAGT